MSSGAVTPMQHCLDRLRAGAPSAQEELLRVSREQVLLLIRQLMHRYARLRRWEDLVAFLQNVLIRLNRSLAEVSLDSPSDFLRLAAVQIRRELTDLARHYFGPEGLAAHHATPDPVSPEYSPAGRDAPDSTNDPASLLNWSELHETIEALPEEDRKMFDLLWYHGLSQAEAAALLNVSVRTVKRRWHAARLRLAEVCHGELPL